MICQRPLRPLALRGACLETDATRATGSCPRRAARLHSLTRPPGLAIKRRCLSVLVLASVSFFPTTSRAHELAVIPPGSAPARLWATERAEEENPLAEAVSNEEWTRERRRLRITTGALWGTFAAFEVTGTAVCLALVYGASPSYTADQARAAWCVIAQLVAPATFIAAVVFSVRLTRHSRIPRTQQFCWPDCANARLSWRLLSPLALRF